MASLSIQVCQGLLIYYGDWKDYDDIREVYIGIDDINQTFQLLNSKLLDLAETPFVKRAKQCLKTCEDNVLQLKARLEKIQKKGPDGTKQKIQAIGLRLLYPFRKSTLDKLKVIVQFLIRQLGVAVQSVMLDSNDSTRKTALLIKESADKISSLSTQIDALSVSTRTQAAETAANVQTPISTEAVIAANVKTLLFMEDVQKLTRILIWLNAPDRSIEHEGARKNIRRALGNGSCKASTIETGFRAPPQCCGSIARLAVARPCYHPL